MKPFGIICVATFILLSYVRAFADEQAPIVVYRNEAPIAVRRNDNPPGIFTPVPARSYDWTGFYLGLNAAGAWGQSGWQGTVGISTGLFSVPGWLAGGTIGYNWQFGPWVFGLEGDGDWARLRGSAPCGAFPDTCETRVYSIDTARARVGYAFDRIMPYFTAGVAIDEITIDHVVTTTAIVKKHQTFLTIDVANQTTGVGYASGVGVETAIYGRWTGKIEYLYVGFEDVGCGKVCSAVPQASISFFSSIVRAGVNFRF